ncbi:MAG TPA: corrinoid protein [bacterium]|nr:corrinoid protein [bacterium]HQO35792.1 corrinoid protein [bacterium]HQP97775.1 corrinoid protein [bacterium]
MVDFQELADSVYGGKKDKVEELVKAAIGEGHSAKEILEEGLIQGMNRIGIDFKNNRVYVPEVLIAARAMKAGMTILRPRIVEEKVEPKGRVAIGTVKGDLHDIGKNLVGMMLEGAGYEVIDLGVDVAPEKFIQANKEKGVGLIGMSSLLTTTMLAMRDALQAFEQAGIRENVKVMVGGAPVTQKWCDEIGADGYAPDAASAVELAESLICA